MLHWWVTQVVVSFCPENRVLSAGSGPNETHVLKFTILVDRRLFFVSSLQLVTSVQTESFTYSQPWFRFCLSDHLFLNLINFLQLRFSIAAVCSIILSTSAFTSMGHSLVCNIRKGYMKIEFFVSQILVDLNCFLHSFATCSAFCASRLVSHHL